MGTGHYSRNHITAGAPIDGSEGAHFGPDGPSEKRAITSGVWEFRPPTA